MKMSVRGLLLLLGLMVISVLVGGSLSVVATADAEACPNEALRTELGSGSLPDCRAYEMVTPPYKEGYPLFAFRYAANGEKAIVGGLANLAGASGAGEAPLEGDLYIDARTQSGWQLSPLNAPLSEFVGQIPLGYEAAKGLTLWDQHTPAQSSTTRNMYIRSATGGYSLVGPLTVPFASEEEEENDYISTREIHYDQPVATTSDFGHIVLSAIAPEDYWPFDETYGSAGSLYEYSGLDNTEPILVGVRGGKKGSREVISGCGTLLGGWAGGGSTYNALSADGESVFFTATVCEGRPAEVYARLHGSLVSPGVAKTVDVSGSECNPACSGEASGKNFEGASEDGGIVFFTSTQKLTNDAVDGAASGNAAEGRGCARTPEGFGGCNLYVYNFGKPGVECQEFGKCLSLVGGGEVLGVAGIAEDGQRVYYVKRASGNMPDLYVYDVATGESKLVATLSFTGEEEETIWQRVFRHPVEVSGEDGRFLLFVSATPGLTADDHASTPQLFEYDAVTGELVRVSKGEDGYNENGNAAAAGVGPESISGIAQELGHGFDFKSGGDRLNVSFDGRTVVFKSRGRLSGLATSAERGCSSIYEFRTGGLLSEGSVHLLSDGVDVQARGAECGAGFEGIDGSGDDVLFSTADPLSLGDVDGVERDIYDARVEGGFPVAQGGSCAVGCVGPAGSVAPGLPVVGSVSQAPEGPVAVPTPVPVVKSKGKVQKKVIKCAKDRELDHGKCLNVKNKKITRKAKRASREQRGRS